MSNNTSSINATASSSNQSEDYVHFIIQMCITWPFVLLGILGNLLVIFIMITKKRRTRPLTNNDIFLVNLACADFLYICFNTAMFTYHLKYFQPHLKTLFYCVVFYPLVSVFYTTGVFIIAAMTVYRCWVITNPFKPKVRSMWIYVCVLAMWISSVILFLPLPITSKNEDNRCPFDETKIHWRSYLSVLTMVQYPLPLLIMMTSYIIIGIYLRKRRIPKTSVVARGNTIQNRREETAKESIALAKTVGVVVLVFAILMLPLQIGMHVDLSFEVPPIWVPRLYKYGDRLAVINSALNPFLYTIRTHQYRKILMSLLQRRPRSSSDVKPSKCNTKSLSASLRFAAEEERYGIELKRIDFKM